MTPDVAPDELEVVANGITFRYLQWGPEDGPLALLLHGFPDTARTWRHLGPVLAQAGYRVVAPWMRGYAPTSLAPDGAYQPDDLAADANALHAALGGDASAVLIGHDWGGLAAYRAGARAPERWRRVVSLAIPPDPVFLSMGLDLRQLFGRSWYTLLFQLPGTHVLAGARHQALIDLLWRQWSPGYERQADDIAPLHAALGAPGAMRAALSYYRGARQAAMRRTFPDATAVPAQPALYLHGADDGCLGASFAAGAEDVLAAGSAVAVLDGVGHFLHLERPDEVAERILAFLA